MKKNQDLSNSIKYSLKTIIKKKPFLLIIYFVSILLRQVSIVQNTFLCKLVIDEVVVVIKNNNSYGIDKLIGLIGLYLTIQFFISLSQNSIEAYKKNCDEYFREYAEIEIAKKNMSVELCFTEDNDFLDDQNFAKDGIDWYSGGILGITDEFFLITSNIISFFSLSVLVIIESPLLLPVYFLVLIVISITKNKMLKIQKRNFEKASKINRAFQYYLYTIADPLYGKDIRLYNALDLFLHKSNHYVDEHTELLKEKAKEIFPYEFILSFFNISRLVLTYVYFFQKAYVKKISIGEFTLFISSYNNLYDSISHVILSIQKLNAKSYYFSKYLDFIYNLNCTSKGSKSNVINENEDEHVIEFCNVSFKYPNTEKYILRNISLKINPGEHISLVGENGAGKTTLVKLLCRFYEVTEGAIKLDGVNINEYEYIEYIKKIAVVFQDYNLFAFSLRENIALSDYKNVTDDKISVILKMLGLGNLPEILPRKFDTPLSKLYDEEGVFLSGGQEQKIAIGRAIYKNAPIIILDEPSSSLDPHAELELYECFRELTKDRSAIFISHRLVSCKFCSKVIVLSEGRIKEVGTHEDLLTKNGIYAKMFYEQAKYYDLSKNL